MIEVKGTTSGLCDSVLMTKNEVSFHRKHKGSTGLIIVSKIRLSRDGVEPTVAGGEVEALLYWDIDEWMSEPIAFQVAKSRLLNRSCPDRIVRERPKAGTDSLTDSWDLIFSKNGESHFLVTD